jgi:hypothetical protein
MDQIMTLVKLEQSIKQVFEIAKLFVLMLIIYLLFYYFLYCSSNCDVLLSILYLVFEFVSIKFLNLEINIYQILLKIVYKSFLIFIVQYLYQWFFWKIINCIFKLFGLNFRLSLLSNFNFIELVFHYIFLTI